MPSLPVSLIAGNATQYLPARPTISFASLMMRPDGNSIEKKPRTVPVLLRNGCHRRMTTSLREGVVRRKPEVKLSGEVECDEVYVVAGHEGHPADVAKMGGPGDVGG